MAWGRCWRPAGLVYFVGVVGYVMPALGGVPQVYRFGGLMAQGWTGLPAVARSMLSNPLFTLVYIVGNPGKLIFLAQLLLPVLFLPLLAGGAWLLALPAFAVALLSSVAANYDITTQYSAIMVPFVYYLAALGIQRLDPRRYARPALACAILVAGLGMNYEYGWLFGKQYHGIPQPTPHQRIVAGFFDEIPQTASLSTLSDLLPHLSNRQWIYLFPDVHAADYILFDADIGANYWPFISRTARSDAIGALITLPGLRRVWSGARAGWGHALQAGAGPGGQPASAPGAQFCPLRGRGSIQRLRWIACRRRGG